MTQTNFTFRGAEFDDFEFFFLTQPESILNILPVRIFDLGHVTQSLNPFVQFDENAKGSMPDDSATNEIAGSVTGEELFPHIRLKLFDPKRKPMIFCIDVENNRLD